MYVCMYIPSAKLSFYCFLYTMVVSSTGFGRIFSVFDCMFIDWHGAPLSYLQSDSLPLEVVVLLVKAQY